MNYYPTRSNRRFGLPALVLALFVLSSSAFVFTASQAQSPAKKALTVDDYTRWRSISGQEISGDGKWVVYGLSFANTLPADAKPVLHLLNLETNQDLEIPNATGGTFSADSRWVAYQVDPSGGRGGRAGWRRGYRDTGRRHRHHTSGRRRRRSRWCAGCPGAWYQRGSANASSARRIAQSRRRNNPGMAGRRVIHIFCKFELFDSAASCRRRGWRSWCGRSGPRSRRRRCGKRGH